LAVVIALAGCVGETAGNPAVSIAAKVPRRFDYVGVDGARFSTETTLGRATVVIFITTYDLISQAVIRRLVDMARDIKPRINAGVIVLEPPRNQLLVEAFAETLDIPFPVAMADQATLERRGPFGDVEVVPTVIVLDKHGVEVWRKDGAPANGELEPILADASR
jgi:hypothetical protein